VSGGHTKGPWQVSGCRHSGDLKIGRDTRLHAVGPDGDAVCMVFYDMKTGRGLRDARLIAAAPMLLEGAQDTVGALKLLRTGLRERAPETLGVIDAHISELEYAIAKALGQ
jgi:hypothetical protein